MATTVNTQKNKHRAMLYYAARDFVHLSFQQKFNVGFQMGLCDHFDAMCDEDTLEEMIFSKAMNDRVLDDLLAVIRRIKYETNEPS